MISKRFTLWLIGNDPADQQESMQRFAALLLDRFRERSFLEVTLLQPKARFRRAAGGSAALGKWLGYLDKFVWFPWSVRRRLRTGPRPDLVHICDHSNAPYVSLFSGLPHLVTCNDLLAIRSARGEFSANRTRWSGRRLQEYILRGLKRAQRVVCISKATLADFARLCPAGGKASVVYMGLNFPYARRAPVECAGLLEARNIQAPFLLHVGGNQWYKNRRGVVEIYERLVRVNQAAPSLVMVGKPFDPALSSVVARSGLESRVSEVVNCASPELAAFYSSAELLLFPSWAEGFGWPIVEAMACGCRVATTGRPPMTEAGGEAAFYLQPESTGEAAVALAGILSQPGAEKEERIKSGYRQAGQFSTERMIEGYLEVYRELLPANR